MTEPTEVEIRRLLGRYSAQISPAQYEDVNDWLGHREWSLAVDMLLDALAESEVPLTVDDKAELRNVMRTVGEDPDAYRLLHE